MCGIVGAVSTRNIVPILIEGLKRLPIPLAARRGGDVAKALAMPNVGIVYNLHHGHDHVDRLKEVLPKLAPHLLAINLNGTFYGCRAALPAMAASGGRDRRGVGGPPRY